MYFILGDIYMKIMIRNEFFTFILDNQSSDINKYRMIFKNASISQHLDSEKTLKLF